MTDLAPARMDRSRLEAELLAAGAVIRGNSVRCPYHDDRNASGSVYQDEAGVWRFKCQAAACGVGGDVFDLQARNKGTNVTQALADYSAAQKPRIAPPPAKVWPTIEAIEQSYNSRHQATYRYADPRTKAIDLVILRVKDGDGKSFRQYRPVAGGWVAEAPPKPWPIYNRSRLLAEPRVIVVEGEKCVHALHDVGIVATTSPCGAGKAQHADWSPLAGKTAYLWPDNDEVGIKHMRAVAEILHALTPPCVCLWVEPTDIDLPAKGDVVDLITLHGGTTKDDRRATVEAVLSCAVPMGASAELSQLVEDTIAGKRKAIRFPWPGLSNATKALLPGTVTMLCGGEGTTKSMMMLWAFYAWHADGIPVSLYELEEDRGHHLNRLLAMLGSDASLADSDWIEAHPDEARATLGQHVAAIEGFGGRLTCAPTQTKSLRELADWTEAQAKAGARIIGLDPITAATPGNKPWVEEHEFIARVKVCMREYGASAILVTHPRPGYRTKGLDDMAGSRNLPRFAQSVLWLKSLEQTELAQVRTKMGTITSDVNRTIRVLKARNSWGAGVEIGFLFSGKTFGITEQGIMVQQ